MTLATDRLQRQLVAALLAHLEGEPLQIPEAGRLAWGWFGDLCATRTYHGAGPNPLRYAEIEAYGRLLGWPFATHHVQLLRALDAAWLGYVRRSVPAAVEHRKVAPGEINAAAFDAVFG